MELILKLEQWEDGFHYEYYVDELGRKQGVLKCFYPNKSNQFKTDKLHAIVNYVNDKIVGKVLGFLEDGFCFLQTTYNEHSRPHGKSIYYEFGFKSYKQISYFDDGVQEIIKDNNGFRFLVTKEKQTYGFNVKQIK